MAVLRLAEHSYELATTPGDSALRGAWKQNDAKEAGIWRAQRVDTTPAEFRTDAVVPFYEYQHAGDGKFFYSTASSA